MNHPGDRERRLLWTTPMSLLASFPLSTVQSGLASSCCMVVDNPRGQKARLNWGDRRSSTIHRPTTTTNFLYINTRERGVRVEVPR
jgi:hypothetical protein